MTDDSESVGPDEQDAGGDPAEAFDALCRTVEDLAGDLTREMTTIRKGVEAAFDRFETFQSPPDYGPDLGRIVAQLAAVERQLEAVGAAPALRNGPDHYVRALETAGSRVSESAARAIEGRARDLERVAADLAGTVRSARARRKQDGWVWGTGAAGLVLGVLLTLFLPRVLYGPVDMVVAATVLNADRWNAGIALMRSGNPTGWRGLVDASTLVRANQETVTACAEAAAKARKEQRCTITVAAPGQ